MKKSFIIILFLLIGTAMFSQTEYDALRMGQSDIVGTARYMSMGGAFGALGGDASALKDNPAGLGVYRTGEFSATLSGLTHSSNSDWYGSKESASSGLGLKFNNASYIMAVPLWGEKTSGLMHSNFSFSYNRVKNFNRAMKASATTSSSFTDFAAIFTYGIDEGDLKYVESVYEPYDNKYIPWLSILAYDSYLIHQEQPNIWKTSMLGQGESADAVSLVTESGGIGEYSLGWGGNYNNNLFLGANLNISDISYSLTSIIKENLPVENFSWRNELNQKGVGVNLKMGVIYLPTNHLRLGAAFHTPTYYTISETSYAKVDFYNPIKGRREIAHVPEGGSRQTFNFQSPLQAQVSAAYLFGRNGLVSMEYNFINYSGMKLSDIDGGREAFRDENDGMLVALQDGHVLKFGGEYKPTENISLRAGYALATSPNNPDYVDGKYLSLNSMNTNTEYFEQTGITNYASVGIGYREASWFIDLTYQLRMQNENFYPYQFNREQLKGAEVGTNTSNIALTVGFKM